MSMCTWGAGGHMCSRPEALTSLELVTDGWEALVPVTWTLSSGGASRRGSVEMAAYQLPSLLWVTPPMVPPRTWAGLIWSLSLHYSESNQNIPGPTSMPQVAIFSREK